MAVNGESFKICLSDIMTRCLERRISSLVFIMYNAKIHHYSEISSIISQLNSRILYLPPYSPFLNPIENVFSKWKNSVNRGEPSNENQLKSFLTTCYDFVTAEDCEGFYRKMLSYIPKAEREDEISE
ncbi:hypothetical protein DMUE_3120 [Dictyocoela muelleri]|nr:hypothetical protein DMUE_3120 [Dictyocoela muelleri]